MARILIFSSFWASASIILTINPGIKKEKIETIEPADKPRDDSFPDAGSYTNILNVNGQELTIQRNQHTILYEHNLPVFFLLFIMGDYERINYWQPFFPFFGEAAKIIIRFLFHFL